MSTAPELLPDLPGVIHGIKSIEPCIVQCDGCGKTDTGDRLTYTVLLSDILFNPRSADTRRMCTPCWLEVDPTYGD